MKEEKISFNFLFFSTFKGTICFRQDYIEYLHLLEFLKNLILTEEIDQHFLKMNFVFSVNLIVTE
jgi:hypothetical protein